jgi:hypothetical protein
VFFTDNHEPELRSVSSSDLAYAAATIDAPAPLRLLGVSRKSTRKAAKQLISALRSRNESTPHRAKRGTTQERRKVPRRPVGFREVSEADIAKGTLHGANLERASLHGASLRGADLSQADLSGASLSDADLRQADLKEAKLVGTDLSGCRMSEAKLVLANLHGAVLQRADLRGANLYNADLTGADFTDAIVEDTIFYGAKWHLSSTRWSRGLRQQLWNASVEIFPNVFEVRGGAEDRVRSTGRV